MSLDYVDCFQFERVENKYFSRGRNDVGAGRRSVRRCERRRKLLPSAAEGMPNSNSPRMGDKAQMAVGFGGGFDCIQ